MVSVQKVEGVHHFAVYNGVTYDPLNPSVVEWLDLVTTMRVGYNFHFSSSSDYK